MVLAEVVGIVWSVIAAVAKRVFSQKALQDRERRISYNDLSRRFKKICTVYWAIARDLIDPLLKKECLDKQDLERLESTTKGAEFEPIEVVPSEVDAKAQYSHLPSPEIDSLSEAYSSLRSVTRATYKFYKTPLSVAEAKEMFKSIGDSLNVAADAIQSASDNGEKFLKELDKGFLLTNWGGLYKKWKDCWRNYTDKKGSRQT